MDPHLSPTIERLAQQGASRFANWQPMLFREYCQATLQRGLELPIAAALAETLCEGVGRGYLAASVAAPAGNLMEHCFRAWLPRRLSAGGAAALALLADTWNLLEGLLREPRWVNAYVTARAHELEKEVSLQAFLTRVLQPLFEPATSASWNGPFRVTWLSLRSAEDAFLPGDMHLVAPHILAVKDRRRDVSLGVILRKEGKSELAGMFGPTSSFQAAPALVKPHWQGESLLLGKHQVQLRFLTEPYRWMQVDAGFVVASAVNSQKLWIVESAT